MGFMNKPLILVGILLGFAIGITTVKLIMQPRGSIGSLSVDQALVEVSKQINQNLPMHLDRETRMDATMPGPGNRLTYLYTLVNVSQADVDPDHFIATIKPQLVNGYRTSPEMADLRRLQVELNYHYRDQTGNSIANITISPRDF